MDEDCSRVFKSDHNSEPDIRHTFNDAEHNGNHEVASRANAKEDQTIRQSNQLTAKTKRLSEIVRTKALARRSQKRAQAPKNMS